MGETEDTGMVIGVKDASEAPVGELVGARRDASVAAGVKEFVGIVVGVVGATMRISVGAGTRTTNGEEEGAEVCEDVGTSIPTLVAIGVGESVAAGIGVGVESAEGLGVGEEIYAGVGELVAVAVSKFTGANVEDGGCKCVCSTVVSSALFAVGVFVVSDVGTELELDTGGANGAEIRNSQVWCCRSSARG